MADTAQETIWHVVGDELGLTCELRNPALDIPCLEACIAGSFDYTLPTFHWWWFARTFIDDPNEIQRIERALYEVRKVFIDLNRLNYALTGEAKPLPEELIRCLEMRLMEAMRPSLYEIAIGAKNQPAARVSQQLKERTTPEQWAVTLDKQPRIPRSPHG